MKIKPNAHRRTGGLPWKQFSRDEIAKFIREYRKNYFVRTKRYADKSRAYQFDDKANANFQTNPYTIAITVARWVPKVRALVEYDNFPNKPTAEKIRAELKEYGAWDDDELNDEDQNWHRLVWLAACSVNDDDAPDCSEPLA